MILQVAKRIANIRFDYISSVSVQFRIYHKISSRKRTRDHKTSFRKQSPPMVLSPAVINYYK